MSRQAIFFGALVASLAITRIAATQVFTLGAQDFADGALVTSNGTWLAAQVNEPSPFNVIWTDPATLTWTHSGLPTIGLAKLSFSLWDLDNGDPGQQVVSLTVNDAPQPLDAFETPQVPNLTVKIYELSLDPALLAPGAITVVLSLGNTVGNQVGIDFSSLAVLPPATWMPVGSGLSGSLGIPVLEGSGTLAAGDPVAISLSSAAPTSLAALVIGLSQANVPFKGGTLVPVPNFIVVGLPTDSAGSLVLGTAWPPGIPSNLTIYFQAWIRDASAVQGFAASNGIAGTTP